jgi:putative endonuclease
MPPRERGGGGSERDAIRWLDPRGLFARRRRNDEDLGLRGERLAARALKRRGYRILERRWRCRLGEIDLVARDGDTLVVVEVKTRSRRDYGPAADAVDARKRRKLEQLARMYLTARRLRDVNVRFDVVGVDLAPGGAPRVQVLRDAFQARKF